MLLMKAFFFFFLRNRSYFGLEAGMFWINLNMIEKTFGMKDVEHLRVFFFFLKGESPPEFKIDRRERIQNRLPFCAEHKSKIKARQTAPR